VLILESKRQFLCVFRGTPAEQQGKFSRQPDLVRMGGLSVFGDRLAAIQELETATFATLDKLTEDNPFCDVVFTGHSYGAAMATLAAQRYALARSELRIAVLTTACPKVGAADFRSAVHSLPNLKVMRVEYGNGRPMAAPNGCQVGHTIRIHPSVGTNKPVAHPVTAYKFGDADDTGRSLFKREKDVSDYVRALESLNTWVQDYHRLDGAGVKGKDNEARQMV
jgi:pimeloyl-ACP methyl ester carboxylesterase